MPKRFHIPGHFVRLIHSGNQYFDTLCQLIDNANKTLYLQVYIFVADETGEIVLDHLQKATARGVQVFFIADGYGSGGLSTGFAVRMQQAGINFKFFSPISIIKAINAGRRLHHKVCVADAQTALVGGINISDKYRGSLEQKPWFDYALFVEGPLCADLDVMCKKIWQKKYNRIKIISHTEHLQSGGVMARMVQNDWLRRKNEISSSYKKKLRLANTSIMIIASYFLPSRRLLTILISAAKNGKSITIILSKKSDVLFIKPAISYLYNRLLESGIRIFEYDESVLHAKAVVVDHRWVSIGSHNLNHLSEFISMEINIEVLDKYFGELFSKELELLTRHQCTEITLSSFALENSLMQKIVQWFSYKLVSSSEWILNLFTRRIS